MHTAIGLPCSTFRAPSHPEERSHTFGPTVQSPFPILPSSLLYQIASCDTLPFICLSLEYLPYFPVPDNLLLIIF